jgi:hypothetical protein
MGSSTRREPWIPDLPDNEAAIADTMREYQSALGLMTLPQLMAQAAQIAEAQQRLSGSTLSTTLLEARTNEYLSAVDRAIPRSRSTALPQDSGRGRASVASQQSRPSLLPSPPRAQSPRAYATARRIAALQVRNEMRERGIE